MFTRRRRACSKEVSRKQLCSHCHVRDPSESGPATSQSVWRLLSLLKLSSESLWPWAVFVMQGVEISRGGRVVVGGGGVEDSQEEYLDAEIL